MEYIKLLEMMIKVQMDDLNDADMLTEYAHKAEEYGSMDIYQKMNARAKVRLQNYDTCGAEIENIIAQMKATNPDVNEKAVMFDIQNMYISDWKERIKEKIAM